MDVQADLRAPAGPDAVFAWIDDLSKYPRWMPLVHSVDTLGNDGDGRPVWQVELRRRIGPLTRSKRLRMVRSTYELDRRVTFERAEVDGRAHSPWVLDAEIEPVVTDDSSPSSSVLTIRLHYGGALWTGGVLERALADDIGRGREGLAALLSGEPRR